MDPGFGAVGSIAEGPLGCAENMVFLRCGMVERFFFLSFSSALTSESSKLKTGATKQFERIRSSMCCLVTKSL